MSKANIDDWKLAGSLAARILDEVSTLIRPRKKILDICEYIEKKTLAKGAKPAFPANISVNNIAAHYTSPPNDLSIIPEIALVKIDIGVSIRGAIADTARTILVGGNKRLYELVKANEEVLEEAIETIRDGVRVKHLSKVIWESSHERGFGVLKDLGGHEIRRGVLHAGLFIPNHPKALKQDRKLRAGMIIAVEPFLVLSANDSVTAPIREAYIFAIKKDPTVTGDRFIQRIYKQYSSLPFALRWLVGNKVSNKKYVRSVLNTLAQYEKRGIINSYPVLVDSNGYWVAQFEHTLLVKKSSVEVLTMTS